MPNWCDNDLVVRGPKKDVARMVRESFSREKGGIGPDFEKIIPYPATFAEHDKRLAALQERAASIRPEGIAVVDAAKAKAFWVKNGFPEGYPKDAYNSGGYEWCVANWGTKWAACEPREYAVASNGERSVLKVRFDTAWSPPKPVILALSRKYPTLSFSLKSYECGAAYKCNLRVKGGVSLRDDSSSYSGNRGG